MCIIIYSQNGVIPKAHLDESLTCNPDGWGYVFHAAGKVVVRRGMNAGEFWRAWNGDAAARHGRPVIFHSRIGTSGTRSVLNCHPFRVPGHGLWLAHNGIIHAYSRLDSEHNDTQHFIHEVLAGLPKNWTRNESILRLVEQSIGHSKLAIMDGAGRVVLLNEHLGHWSRGLWYSNDSYLPYVPEPVLPAQRVLFGKPCRN